MRTASRKTATAATAPHHSIHVCQHQGNNASHSPTRMNARVHSAKTDACSDHQPRNRSTILPASSHHRKTHSNTAQ
eukprot:9956804-Alexandrium_andersonii.AAC.1